MTEYTIHSVTKANVGVTLVVFHSERYCWQFLIVLNEDLIFADNTIFLVKNGAEEAGWNWISQLRQRNQPLT
jgi:hypothetical protein